MKLAPLRPRVRSKLAGWSPGPTGRAALLGLLGGLLIAGPGWLLDRAVYEHPVLAVMVSASLGWGWFARGSLRCPPADAAS